MPTDSQRLASLRAEIDRIDDAIHDLLMSRAELVEEVASAKADDRPPVRPAREAEVMRRIFARHQGPFPTAALMRIWREMIAGYTAMQAKITVAVAGEGENQALRDLARDHFGSVTAMVATSGAAQTVRLVVDGQVDLGVVPWPEASEDKPWWPPLVTSEPLAPRVVACLPFLTSGKAMQRAGLVIARLPFEPTGQDRSLLAVEVRENVSRSRLRQALDGLGLPATQTWAWDDLARGGGPALLVEIEGYVGEQDSRLTDLAAALDGAIGRVQALGGFAMPLRLPAGGGPKKA